MSLVKYPSGSEEPRRCTLPCHELECSETSQFSPSHLGTYPSSATSHEIMPGVKEQDETETICTNGTSKL